MKTIEKNHISAGLAILADIIAREILLTIRSEKNQHNRSIRNAEITPLDKDISWKGKHRNDLTNIQQSQ